MKATPEYLRVLGRDATRLSFRLLVIVITATLLLGSTGCTKSIKKSRHLGRANKYYAAGQFDKAEIEYLNVIRIDPANLDPVAVRNLGTIYYDRGDLVRALSFLAKTEELEPDNFDARIKLARYRLMISRFGKSQNDKQKKELEQNYTNALTAINYILSKQPGNEEAILLLPATARSTGEVAQIQLRLQQLRQQAGDKVAFHLVSAAYALDKKDIKTAEAEYRQALSLNPKSSEAHMALGKVFWYQTNLAGAEQEFKIAAENALPRSETRLAWVEFKLNTGAVQEAKKALEEITKTTPGFINALSFQADIAFAEGKFKECAPLVQKILELNPTDMRASLLHARLEIEKEREKGEKADYATAAKELEQLASVYPHSPQVLYYQATAHLLNKDPIKAIGDLEKALTENPNYMPARMLLAQLNLRRGDTARVISSLTPMIDAQVAQKQPPNPAAYMLLADAQRRRKAPDEALSLYQRLSDYYPTNPQPYVLMGQVLAGQNKLPDARKSFNKALQYAPDSIEVTELLARLDLAERQPQAAMQRLQKTIDKYPNVLTSRMLMAQIYYSQTNFAQAEATLLKAIEVGPDAREPYSMLAQLYVKENRVTQAIEKLEAILAKKPKDGQALNWQALMQLAMLQEMVPNYPAARDNYEKLLKEFPKSPLALNNLAYLYSEQDKVKDPVKAYDYGRKAREAAPSDPAIADTFGWILFRKGEYPSALSLIQESAEKLPSASEIQYHLGMTHYMMGAEAPARAAFERALQLQKEQQEKSAGQPVKDFIGKAEVEQRLAMLNMDAKAIGPQAAAVLEKRLIEEPADPVALNRLADLYERSGAADKILGHYEKALKLNPKAVPVLLKLAQIYSMRPQDSVKALELARTARNLAPEDPSVGQVLGRVSFQAGEHKYALTLLQDSARKLANQPDVLYDLGLAYYSVGQLAEAQASVQSALRVGTNFSRAEAAKRFLAVTSLYPNPDQSPQVLAQIPEILKTEPDYVPALLVAGLRYEQSSNPAAARPIYEKILAKYPLFAPAMKALASLYAANPADATKAYELAVKAREGLPQDADLAKTLGLLVYKRGEFARAIQLLRESSSQRTNDAEVFYYLSISHAKLKQKSDCKTALDRAIALNPNHPLAAEAKKAQAELK